MRIGIWACFALWVNIANAQDLPADSTLSVNQKVRADLSCLAGQSDRVTADIQRQSLRALSQLQKKEASLQQVIMRKDSVAGKAEAEAMQQYSVWKQRVSSLTISGASLTSAASPLKEYVPHLDSLQTAVRFLSVAKLSQGLSANQLASLQGVNGKLAGLSSSLQQANEVGEFISQRQASLQDQLSRLGMVQQLLAFKKQAYYYKDQLTQYKALLNDPNRLASRVLTLVQNRPAFQSYFRKNSTLASLFRLPGGDSLSTGLGAPGLQTRLATAELVKAKTGKPVDFPASVNDKDNSGGSPLGGAMQQAQEQLSDWKQKMAGIGGGGSAAAMPDFQPNPQHNKTFFRRLQLGFDWQTQNSSYFIPAISTFGASLGYKISSRSVAGVGAGYLLGWGQPFSHISFSSQGANWRSFFHWKMRSSLWVSGGFEMNYYNAFSSLSQLRVLSAWQSSALMGLMKTYTAGSRQGNVQLLFDALYKQHVPQSQPLIFRVGYSLN